MTVKWKRIMIVSWWLSRKLVLGSLELCSRLLHLKIDWITECHSFPPSCTFMVIASVSRVGAYFVFRTSPFVTSGAVYFVGPCMASCMLVLCPTYVKIKEQVYLLLQLVQQAFWAISVSVGNSIKKRILVFVFFLISENDRVFSFMIRKPWNHSVVTRARNLFDILF